MKYNQLLPPIIQVLAIAAILCIIGFCNTSHEAVKWQGVTVPAKDTAEFFKHVKPEAK